MTNFGEYAFLEIYPAILKAPPQTNFPILVSDFRAGSPFSGGSDLLEDATLPDPLESTRSMNDFDSPLARCGIYLRGRFGQPVTFYQGDSVRLYRFRQKTCG
jgi:hypothetical protein